MKSFKFDVHIQPSFMGDIEIGKEFTLTLEDVTFNATVVAIDGSRVTHEVTGEEVDLVEPLFQPTQKSFSIGTTIN